MQIRAEEISKIIKEQIEGYEQRVEMSETGTVLYVAMVLPAFMVLKMPCPWSFWSFQAV